MTFEAEIIQIKAENQELKQELLYITHELAQLKHIIFGHRSERIKTLYYDNVQQKLFEDEQPAEKPEAKMIKVRSHDKVKAKKNPKQVIFPAELPR